MTLPRPREAVVRFIHSIAANQPERGQSILNPAAFDAIYMLHWEGWETEVVSNRWHYAERWLKHVPVTMVVPDLEPDDRPRAEIDPRIEGLEVLHVPRAPLRRRAILGRGADQAAAITSHMRARGHTGPVLWQYNPFLTAAATMVPALARVHHATENYVDMARDRADALEDPAVLSALAIAAVDLADVVICCSSGVREGLAAASGRYDLDVVPNGCDFALYSSAQRLAPPVSDLVAGVAPGGRVAIYAGNVNSRLDFDLVERLVDSEPHTRFVFVGPVSLSDSVDAARAWTGIRSRPNVRVLEEMRTPADLAALYQCATVGFIPYRNEPFIVRNGLPLKALEMACTGLPVISTEMSPLRAVEPAAIVCRSSNDFLASFSAADRAAVPRDTARVVAKICREHDYDRLFDRAYTLTLKAVERHAKPALGSLEPLGSQLGSDLLAPRGRVAAWLESFEDATSPRSRLLHVLPPRMRGQLRGRARAFRAWSRPVSKSD